MSHLVSRVGASELHDTPEENIKYFLLIQVSPLQGNFKVWYIATSQLIQLVGHPGTFTHQVM